MKAWFALSTLTMLWSSNGQVLRHHRYYLCDDAGEKEGLRLQSTMDLSLCLTRHGDDSCYHCRCKWVKYLGAAKACFMDDLDFMSRVLQNEVDWNANYINHCNDNDDLNLVVPEFSLDLCSEAAVTMKILGYLSFSVAILNLFG